MTGLLGGGHAVYWDAAAGRAWHLDCFCAVPSAASVELVELRCRSARRWSTTRSGRRRARCPGVPAGLGALTQRFGALPWRAVLEPAMRLARTDVELPPAHAACLAMLAPVMTLRPRRRDLRPGGRLLEAGDTLAQPGLVTALDAARGRGRAQRYEGSLAEALLA